MHKHDLEFKNENPGVVRFGNFINYYKFHPPENRIEKFPKDIWVINDETCCCVDVGCNAGNLTTELYKFLKQNLVRNVESKVHCKFLGIDIDPTLILRATEINNDTNNLQFQCLDVMNESHFKELLIYLQNNNKVKFDISFCLSITMWIHLNHGDDGLRNFLIKICKISKMVVIEPQPWKCYKTAVKRLKQINDEFPYFKQLKYRHNIEDFIKDILQNQCGFHQIFESNYTNWGRKIFFYKQYKDI